LALPLIAAEVIFALSGFTATVMIAHLGKEELAANALVWNIYIAVILFFIGILCSVSIMVSQSFGAKDDKGISICFKQGIIMALIFALPMMLLMWVISPVLVLAKQDSQVIRCAEPFFHALVWVMLPINIVIAIEQFLIGITRTRIVMLVTIITVPTQIFFYYLFLFGKFGLPKMGLAGIGYGLAISHSIVAICLISYLLFSKTSEKYALFKKWWVVDKKFLTEMFRVGLPLGLMWCSEVTFFAVVAIMMGLLGVSTLAAFQITDQFLLIGLVVLFALSQNTAIRVGYEAGRGDRSKLKLTTAVNIMIGLGLVSIFSLFYTFFPQVAIGLDIDISSEHYKDVAMHALEFFPLAGILLFIDSIRLISNGALRGLKDTNCQLLISIFGFWLIAFPTAYFLAFRFKFGGIGIWWGIIVSLFITGIVLLTRFIRLAKTIDLSLLVTKK
jgi:MATE family multidrug resistance protein